MSSDPKKRTIPSPRFIEAAEKVDGESVSPASKSLLSRRSFLFTLAAFSVMPLQGADAAFTFEPFQFGYVTGTHLATKRPDSFRMVQESQLFLQDAVKQLNQENLDFVLFGGDQVDVPGKDEENWQLFIDIVQTLNCPWNFVLGEHDVSGVVNKMDTYGRDWKGKGINSPKAYWSNDPKPGIHVVGLDTGQSDLTVGALSEAQLDWLKRDLDSNKGKFTIVMSHHPLLPPAPFDSGPPWEDWIVPQGANAREIMAAHQDVRLALSGHVYVNKIQQEEKIWYVSSPSLAVYPCAFRIFRVTPQSITVETYQISYPALIKKAKKAIESWSLAYKYSSKIDAFCELLEGAKDDQNVRLSLTTGKRVEIEQPKRKKPKDKDDKDKGKDKGKEKDKDKEDKGKVKEEKHKEEKHKKPKESDMPEPPPRTSQPAASPTATPDGGKPAASDGGKPATPDAAKSGTPEAAKAATPDGAKAGTPDAAKSGTPDSAKPTTPDVQKD